MKRLSQIVYESFGLLLEYDLEKTIKQHGDKALDVALKRMETDSYLDDVHGLYHGYKVNKDDNSDYKRKAMNELMSQFEEADPTPNKKYVQHIARIYGNGGFDRHEDVFSRGKQALKKFHDLASRKVIPAEQRDIGRVKSLRELEDIVDQHKDKLSGKQEDAAYHEKMKQQADITEHGTFTHIIPHTAEASRHFGKGTRWCTATDDLEDSMHDTYSANGPLQIYAPKEPKRPGEKYQYHYSSDQLMDETDKPVGSTGHNDIDVHIGNYRRNADVAHQSRAGFDHPEAFVRRRTLKNFWDSADRNDLDKVVQKGLFGTYEEDHYQDSNKGIGESPLYHPAATSHHVFEAMKNPNWDVRASTMWSPHFNQEHRDYIVDNWSREKLGNEYNRDDNPGEIRNEVFRNTTNPEHFERAFKTLGTNDEDSDAIQGMAFNKKTPKHMIDKLIEDKAYSPYAIQNDSVSDEVLKKAAKSHPDVVTRKNAEYSLAQREKKPKRNNEIKWHGR